MSRELFRQARGEAPYLVATRCRHCRHLSFPPRPICPRCGQEDVEEMAAGRSGRIQSSAVVHNAPTGFTAPYVVALVALEEGPIVFCPITGCPPEEAAVPPGTPVELVVAPARPEGAPVIQYRPTGG